MVRLWPQTLLGRLTLTLLLVLILAQLASAVILFYERGQSLNEALGVQTAERIAGLVRLFSSMPPAERERVASAFNTHNLRITFSAMPIPLPEQDADSLDAVFGPLIQRVLGPSHPVRVQLHARAQARSSPSKQASQPMLTT